MPPAGRGSEAFGVQWDVRAGERGMGNDRVGLGHRDKVGGRWGRAGEGLGAAREQVRRWRMAAGVCAWGDGGIGAYQSTRATVHMRAAWGRGGCARGQCPPPHHSLP